VSPELIDVLDENGQKTEQVLPIDEVHKQELWHGVAHIWVYNDKGQILLQLRHPNKSWGGGKWDLAGGGHISASEAPDIAALRELKEELGLDAKLEELELVGITVAINITTTTQRTHKAHEWNYLVQLNINIDDVVLHSEESAEAKWFDLDEFEADINNKETDKKYADRDVSLYKLVITKIREALSS
jgi:8-oxo-dGTP pyrophosphatase MutT (NUDIX family)